LNTLCLIIALVGLAYLCTLVAIYDNPNKAKNFFRRQLDPGMLAGKFHSERMQTVLREAGFNIASQKINLFRYLGIAAYLFISYVSMSLRKEPFSVNPMIVSGCLLFFSSPLRMSPSGWVLRKIQFRNIIKRDSELITFLRLYESNRLRKGSYVQFPSFCLQIAPHFNYIKKDLMILSQRTVEDGLENALDWFITKFPADHSFISDIRTILISTEGMKDEDMVIAYLREQSKIIAKISTDQYLRRWTFWGDLAAIVNGIPSLATFLMMIVIVMLYVLIIKNTYNLNIFSS
jgi:hypothetical protein